ncbi:MAG: T9SS type A sorting domain-containing protein [Bacteroidota bacterium]
MYRQLFTLIAILPIFTSTLFAQRAAFCGITTNNPDEIAIVMLDDFKAGEVIYISDEAYNASFNAFFGAVHGYVVPLGGLAKGEVIRITEPTNNNFTLYRSNNATPVGTFNANITGGDGRFSIHSDESFSIFSASNPSSPGTSVTSIYMHVTFDGQQDGGDEPSTDPNAPLSNGFIRMDFSDDDIESIQFKVSERSNTTLNDFTDWRNWNRNEDTRINQSTVPFTNLQFGGGGIFPVEWLSFTGEEIDQSISLEWSTANELNNDHFVIEKSTDGTFFRKIGEVDAVGNSQEIQNYQFSDLSPGQGILYYRLKQIDIDGAFSYSTVLELSVEGAQQVSLYPNPVSDRLEVRGSGKELIVYSILGQKLKYQRLNSEFELIDLSDLQQGTYLIQVLGENQQILEAKRIMKI